MNLCVQNLYRNQTNVDNLTKSSFYDLFELPCLNHFLLSIESFLNNYGAAKGYSLGPKLANAFMHHFGKHWVGKQSASFQNNFVIHDTFLIFRSKDHIEKLSPLKCKVYIVNWGNWFTDISRNKN